MCTTCGRTNCTCPCEDCGCNGVYISGECVQYTGDSLPLLTIIEGDSFNTVITNIENYFSTINEIITNITEGLTEIERGDGAPTSIPTGTDPILYINELTGDLYTWDGSAWILFGSSGILLAPIAGTVVTGATVGPSIVVAPASGYQTSFTVQPKYTNEAYVDLQAYLGGNTSGAISPYTADPKIRLRWDGEVEMDGLIILTAASLIGASCYQSAKIITICGAGALPVKYRPTVASCPHLAKIIPCVVTLEGSGISMIGCELDSLSSYAYLAEMIVWNTGKIDVRINDHRYNDDLDSGITFTKGLLNIGHIKYYVN